MEERKNDEGNDDGECRMKGIDFFVFLLDFSNNKGKDSDG